MSTIKGQNFRVFLGGKAVAFATNCTLHISANLEDSSTKDSDGDFTEQELTSLSWDGSAAALYSVDSDTTGMNGEAALDAILAKQQVTIEYSKTSGTQNRTETGTKYSGKAFVNDINVQAQNRQNTTYTIQFTGTGALTKSSASGAKASVLSSDDE